MFKDVSIISYPRTGYHWLNFMLTEYLKHRKIDFEFKHSSEIPSGIEIPPNMVFIHRKDYTSQVYSMMKLRAKLLDAEPDLTDEIERIKLRAEDYANNMYFWLRMETGSLRKVVVEYGEMRQGFEAVIREFVEKEAETTLIDEIFNTTTKEKVAKNAPDYIPISKEYEAGRADFKKKYEKIISEIVTEIMTNGSTCH